MWRLSASLPLVLLLVCCDNPNPGIAENDEGHASEMASARRKHSIREKSPEKPAALLTALRTADRMESAALREKALAEVAWGALEINPALAHEAFQKLPAACPEKIRLIQHYAMRLAGESIDEAISWSDTLASEQEVAAAKCHIAVATAETDPQRAANILSESGIVGRDFDVAVVQVVQRWAARSAQDAAAWVSMFSPGPAREAGIRVIVESWMKAEPSAVFLWLENTKDLLLRKETARAIAGVILQQPPQSQRDWLSHTHPGIQGELESLREQAASDVGNNMPAPRPRF